MQIISGSNNRDLAKTLSNITNYQLTNSTVGNFNDGELRVQIFDKITQDVVLLQSVNAPVNDSLMELLLLVDTVRRAGAKNIVAMIPYLGYSRQDRSTYQYGPISISLVAKMFEASGISKLITLDLHSKQIEGMFNIPIMNINSIEVFLPIIEQKKQANDTIIISPDIGGISRAREYSAALGIDFAIIDKHRDLEQVCSMGKIIGDVKRKHCIIIDDIIDSASTICKATTLLMQHGAISVEVIATHPVLSKNAISNIKKSAINHLYISNSITHTELPDNFTIIPIHRILGDAISLNA